MKVALFSATAALGSIFISENAVDGADGGAAPDASADHTPPFRTVRAKVSLHVVPHT